MLFEHGQEHLSEFFIAAQLQILVVEPFAFLVIKFCTGLGDTVKRELLDEFIHRVHFLIACAVPTEQGQEVDDRFGQVATLAISR